MNRMYLTLYIHKMVKIGQIYLMLNGVDVLLCVHSYQMVKCSSREDGMAMHWLTCGAHQMVGSKIGLRCQQQCLRVKKKECQL